MQITDEKTIPASKVLIKVFERLGIDKIFGYPGSSVLALYDELAKENSIKHYLFRHEAGAVHAAEGYARTSGKCGVVLVTAGPGASNTITGIISACFDGVPLIVISGQVPQDAFGKDSFQEINFVEIVKTFTKAAFRVESADELESLVLQAWLIATSGKKGPVVIEIPKNVLENEAEYKNLTLPADKNFSILNNEVTKTIELLKSSTKPVIIAGGGCSNSVGELLEFAEMLNMPVVSTMMGTGSFPQNNPLYSGMIGLYGDSAANKLVENSDLLLVLGSRFNDRISSVFDLDLINRKSIIHVDINAKNLLRNLHADVPVNSDVKMFLKELISSVSGEGLSDFHFDNFAIAKNFKNDFDENLTVKNVVKYLFEYTKNFSPVIAADVGQHQIALIKNYQFNEPCKLLVSGGFGAMGFGLPAAIGASLAQDKRPVVVITGDGSFQMNFQELAVCSEYKIPVKILVINNGYLGMVRQLQEEQYNGRFFETALKNPDFVMLANSFGIDAVRVTQNDEVTPALDKAFKSSEPFVIEFVTEPFENV